MSAPKLAETLNYIASVGSEAFRQQEIKSNKIEFSFSNEQIKKEIITQLDLLSKRDNVDYSLHGNTINKLVKAFHSDLRDEFNTRLKHRAAAVTEIHDSGTDIKITIDGAKDTFKALKNALRKPQRKFLVHLSEALNQKGKNPNLSSTSFFDVEHLDTVSDLRNITALYVSGLTHDNIKQIIEGTYTSSGIQQALLNIASKWSGNIKSYTITAELKSSLQNQAEGRSQIAIRKNILVRALRNTPEKFVFGKSSDSYYDHVNKSIVQAIGKPLKQPNIKKKLDKEGARKKERASSKASKTITNKVSEKVKKVKVTDMIGPLSIEGDKIASFNLKDYINERLHTQLKADMRTPRLQYRTGQFATSVEVTKARITDKRNASVSYTYQKRPYQVFEPGLGAAPWASVNRDPRRLIQDSIRSIAAEKVKGRFYFRRV